MSIELLGTRPYNHSLHHLVGRMYKQTFGPFTSESVSDGGSTGFDSLPVNVWETPDAYVATVMGPGLDEQSINVTLNDDTVAIEGAFVFQAPEGARPIWQEFNPGPSRFRRSLKLGASLDASKMEALYRNGLLLITMPKAENAKPRRIRVQLTSTAVPEAVPHN